MSAKKFELAIAVLELNLRVFPNHFDSYYFLAKNHLLRGDRAQASAILQKSLELWPGESMAAALLEEIQ